MTPAEARAVRIKWLRRRIETLDRRIKPHGNAADAAVWAGERDGHKEELAALVAEGEGR